MSDESTWDFETALRERVEAEDPLAMQCAYLLGLWSDGLDESECTQVEEGEEPCGACYFCQSRIAGVIEREMWDRRRRDRERRLLARLLLRHGLAPH